MIMLPTCLPVLLFETIVACSIVMIVSAQSSHFDQNAYEEGKKQFELTQHRAKLPQYGQCWKDVIHLTESGCQRLTDDVQGRLALTYLNCFLQLQGRPKHECNHEQSLSECTKLMDSADRSSFTTFFTHTQNICYFLRVQVWNEVTENTISALAESSLQVASQLKESSQLQVEMIKQQNDSLKNQKILMENAANLTNVLSSSSEEINELFQSLKETTQEQRILITDVFDQLINLKTTVLGEFTSFYSVLYYFFSVLVCYLLTSSTRTSSARFWLFSIVTSSIFCEYLVSSYAPRFLQRSYMGLADENDWLYWLRSSCRKLFAGIGLLTLGLCAYNYRDINAANNKLLMEIRKQNSDLKRLLANVQLSTPERKSRQITGLASADFDKETDTVSFDSSTLTSSFSSESDRTYILHESDQSISESDSYTTAETLRGSIFPAFSMSGSDSLTQELRDLHRATPLKEMSGQVEKWISTGMYLSPSQQNNSSNQSPYFLRPRRGRLDNAASLSAQVESPQSFAKTVRQLERIAKQNSKMVCAAVTAKTSGKDIFINTSC